MTPKHIRFLSRVLWVSALCMIAVCWFFCSGDELPESKEATLPRIPMQKPSSFAQSRSLKEALASPYFSLAPIDRPIRLPDLRSLLVFYGANERPDRSLSSRKIQFGLRGFPTVSSVPSGEKVFFKYDLRQNKWTLSDTPTPLVAVFSPLDPNVQVTLEFQEENGTAVITPAEFHIFSLAPIPSPPSTQPQQWSIGDALVDISLLDRQGAVWWGQDEVVLAFGGDEMARQASRQRVQFGLGSEAYVLWVAEGDCFIYSGDKWVAVEPGEASVGKPLLQAKLIDDRAIHFQLWNGDGTLHHSVDLAHRGVVGEFKIPEVKVIGARSKRQWIAEIHGKRITLTPDDWVVVTSEGFVQLNSPKLLDEYLQGSIAGDLFAFSGIEKVNGELCLSGIFYDVTRTRYDSFAIPLYRSSNKANGAASETPIDEEFSDDDDDYDEDDDILFEDDDDDDNDDD